MNITSENEYRFAQIKAVMLFILKSFPSGVDFIKLYKIMYFAQKKFLSQYGKIIFDDSFVAKKLGPVPYYTHDAIHAQSNGKVPENKEISSFLLNGVSVNDNCVRANQEPNVDYISVKARQILSETIEKYKDIDSMTLSDMSHDSAYDEAEARYQKNHADNKLSLTEIAKAGGASPDLIEYIQTKIAIKKAFAV